MPTQSTKFIFRAMLVYLIQEHKKARNLLALAERRRSEGADVDSQLIQARHDAIAACRENWRCRETPEDLEKLSIFFGQEYARRTKELEPYEEGETEPDFPKSKREMQRSIHADINSFILLLQREKRALRQ